jgi:uncharacterized Zn finger protein (UPF0148 family)
MIPEPTCAFCGAPRSRHEGAALNCPGTTRFLEPLRIAALEREELAVLAQVTSERLRAEAMRNTVLTNELLRERQRLHRIEKALDDLAELTPDPRQERELARILDGP